MRPARDRTFFVRNLDALSLLCTLVCFAPNLEVLASEKISFRTDVMAVLSKAGCNAGACHGNANGKAGFKLSLRGEDPEHDFKILTRDQLARRVNPIDPATSLILLKATTEVAHEGGERFKKDSSEYRTLQQWVASGAKDDAESARKLERIEVSPSEKILIEPLRSMDLRVTAFFADKTSRDVTSLAVYEAANGVAKVSYGGRIERESDGETVVIVRYLDRQVPVRITFVPARPGFKERKVAPRNYVDKLIFSKLKTLRMNPSELCRDEEFMRRAYLDLLGILPAASEAQNFVADHRPEKRARLVDELLQRPEFAEFWALKWADLLRMEERVLDRKGSENFLHWIRQSIDEGKPMDQFARELIAARGSTYQEPAANYYRAIREPAARAEAAAQVFLGIRLQCAQCHNHPFDRWTQDDYYGWAGFFSAVQYKVLENKRRDSNDSHEFKGEQVVYAADRKPMKNPRSGKPVSPRFLGDAVSPAENPTDKLDELAQWMTSARNPLFARSQVNRIWFHLMGRGIVDPIDDFRPTNPASHPELLDRLAADFVQSKFDLRHMIRLIMDSRTYQLSAIPNETNGDDEMNYSHIWPRRLSAEQLLDCEGQVTGAPVKFAGYPAGMRAAQIPGTVADRKHDRKASEVDQVLEVFGKPQRLLSCECERSAETTMGQAFQLISGPAINEMLTRPGNRIAELAQSQSSNEATVTELYWSALTRAPQKSELANGTKLLAHGDRKKAIEDLCWALLNAKEFVFRK